MADYALGDYMVTKTGGWFAWGIRAVTHSSVNHAAVYIGDGLLVEAQPWGAEKSPVGDYPNAIWSTIQLTGEQRLDIAEAAVAMCGTPYNFLDIAAQAIVRIFHWHAPKWALNRLSRSDRLQCSQLVDVAYEKAGVHLFPEGRPEGMVSPEDLRGLITHATA